jgi:hypothetical protein
VRLLIEKRASLAASIVRQLSSGFRRGGLCQVHCRIKFGLAAAGAGLEAGFQSSSWCRFQATTGDERSKLILGVFLRLLFCVCGGSSRSTLHLAVGLLNFLNAISKLLLIFTRDNGLWGSCINACGGRIQGMRWQGAATECLFGLWPWNSCLSLQRP